MNKLTKIGGIFIVLVALAILAGTTFTFAQEDPTPDTTTPDEETNALERRGARSHIIDRDALKTAISDTLGLTVEELREMKAEGLTLAEIAEAQGVAIEDVEAAVQAVVTEAVETAVSEGTITQEQADLILEQVSAGELGGRFFGGKRGGSRGFGGAHFAEIDFDMEAVVADALGITAEELDTYKEDGLNLTEIAEELGVDLADVQTAVEEAREAAINQAVADGTITQEQADQLLERGSGGFGRGGHGGGRGHRGNSQGAPFGGETAPETDTSDA